jgi:hypothetical protein
MRLTAALASLSLLSFAYAQNNSTNSTSPQVITIEVGGTTNEPGGIFQFKPNNVTNATNGTVINFRFTGMPGNHSITQSTFAEPCTPMDGGFDSGWVLLPTPNLSPVPEWNLTITNDKQAIWFFCKQLLPQPHCSSGMVGAINPPTSGNNTLENFMRNAHNTSSVGQTQEGLVGQGASASARPAPIPSGATVFPAAPSSGALGLSSSLSSVAPLLMTAGLTSLLIA